MLQFLKKIDSSEVEVTNGFIEVDGMGCIGRYMPAEKKIRFIPQFVSDFNLPTTISCASEAAAKRTFSGWLNAEIDKCRS